jgi:hypothetical protein
VVELQSSKHEVWNSNISIARKEKGRKKKETKYCK